MVWDKHNDDELTKAQKVRLRPKILTIPVEDRRLLKEIGDKLMGLGRDMLFNATREGVSNAEVGYIIKNRIDELNEFIGHRAREEGIYMPRRGRKPAGEREHDANEPETNSVVPITQPQNLVNRGVRK